MRNIKPQMLGGLASLLLMLGAVAFLAYGAIIGCPAGGVPCVGTNAADTITAGTAAQSIFGLGGNDTINDTTAVAHLIFGGTGNDTFNITSTGAKTILGEDGNDIFNVTGALALGATLNGGRGNDTFNIIGIVAGVTITDGPGRDAINILAATGGVTLFLVGDNEPDSVFIDPADGNADTIVLDRNSGQDLIVCGGGFDIVFLNGNNKAVGRVGGVLVNLRQIALLGGSTDTCEIIIP